MSVIIKVIALIVLIWGFFHIIKFISAIKISSGNSPNKGGVTNRKSGMDIKDADYEEVE